MTFYIPPILIIFMIKVLIHANLINFETHGHTTFLYHKQMLKALAILDYDVIGKINLRLKVCQERCSELTPCLKIYVIEHVKEILYETRHQSIYEFMLYPRLQLKESFTF
jgi:hypothetical protein